MLIIAIPKSASTSLMVTIGELHKLEAVQDFSFRENSPPKSSNKIHLVHSDIRELSQNEIDKFSRKDTFYKQHIFPSANNLKLLKNLPKVVLLRNPKEIIMAYQRGAKRNYNSLPPGYDTKLKKEDLIIKAKRDGFYNDLVYFYDNWNHQTNNRNTLIIYYNDFLKNPKKVINEIEKFYNLPITKKNFKPAKARYSKIGIKDRLNIFQTKTLIFTNQCLIKIGAKDFLKRILKSLK
ncbi:sulfotransferase domain-containing protein [Salegentibacter sediminis]|uniref:sulfotransferase domain-containing protein n=1 Tax=Salegentibacter sediminis TaxID=1930251 RepID=UPI0009BF9A46|nr:sulfotransferase domain-containing protein [Salegentibacter sediminis]